MSSKRSWSLLATLYRKDAASRGVTQFLDHPVEETSSYFRARNGAVINVIVIYTDGVETTKFCTVRGP
jgi:hypothetical protein